MQYIDRNTKPGRIEDNVRPLLEAMLENKQIRYADHEEPPHVTKAIKYERQRQDRRDTSTYTGDDQFVQSIIDVFGFDPLDFQINSWQTVDELDERRRTENDSKGAVFSAPTGFGKTEAFLGPLYQLLREERQESVAIVYPSRALLQDQLGRILEHVHAIGTEHDNQLSVGCYVGGMPWEVSDVGTEGFFEKTNGRPRFKLCNCWCGENESHAFELHNTSKSYVLECEHDSSHRFTDRELVLSRKDLVFNHQPDIVLTTLESLENFAHKPHYPLVDSFDTIVLDEVHLYTGLRGAHAAKIIQNVDDISDSPLLWLGSSATIDDPERFGRQIFGLSSRDIETTKPPESDYDDGHDDYEHYYFMLAPEDGPGVTSMAIQQSMLLGHTMLEDTEGNRSKQLSFIDSISQINQQRVQLRDADRSNELWQYHRRSLFEEDWDSVASSMGQRFIDEPLQFLPVYSDQGFDKDHAADSDILLSTNFLEVGIDVGEIKIVTQHRTPWNLSSFLQRAGRAARKPGMDSHVAVYLSSLTGDANMFYRADRFLGSDIRTPLNTDNRVVEWMHDRFNRYFNHVSEIDAKRFRSSVEAHRTFLEDYLREDLEYDAYYEMIINPKEFFDEALGLDVPADQLLSQQVVDDVRDEVDEYLEEQSEELSDIEEYFGMEDGEIIRGSDAIETYILEVQEQTLRVVNTFDGQVSGFVHKLEKHDASGYDDLVESLNEELANTREEAQELPDVSPAETVAHFSSLLARLFGLLGKLMELRNHANRAAEEPIPQVNQEKLSTLNDAVNQLETLSEDDRLQEYYQLEKQIHHLRSALEEYRSYLDANTPYNSLYRIKDLLRGAYYFDLYLQTTDERLDDDVWFVPPDYFGSSGQFVKVFRENDPQDRPEESIDQILSTYAPYHSEYQSESGRMQVFLPDTTVTEDGVVMDYTKHVSGEEQEGVLVPDTLQLSEVQDLSGDSAMEIVQYCPECFQVLPSDIDRCLRHEQREYGKIHSEPHVDTTVTNRTPIEQTGDLTLADLEAKVSLESVTLEITPGRYYGDEIGVAYDKDTDRFSQELQSPETPLGYTTRTRGLVYDMDTFLDSIEDEVREYVERYKDLDDTDFEYLAYHTAAHFFLQFVTDVSSVSNQRVFYGFDEGVGEVYVFERTEGGQGIVDLVYDEIQSDPGSVLESMNRLLYNEQVIGERLWSRAEFVGRLPTDDPNEETIRSIVVEYLPIAFDDVIDRVTGEIVSTVDHAHQFATDEDIAVRDAYDLKHIVAAAQINGEDEFPTDAVEQHETNISDSDRVKAAFHSPDIDGCVENLHITDCIEAGEQSETLSYVVLEALREHLTTTVPATDAADEMFDQELPPGGEINGTSIFLDF
ncbi:DEAD/DEAH box helicase [Natranaeroarchaeum sulfidigenes]|uniref:Distinct helicase family with a unique C-terminal domain including a metal-binding cysteine cluster n=1 Tax=Natranaeroarchaeum sulfidigenes TaxID=2784880 RepID=A0A897MWW6_9EURY|nr:DEAD/DEAH box helicase [Natranaeroarchaeum sulfidigenes]QSG02815.1 Distinct helicase family with a unique C-terminal domain including a metal-binding cysteine cluster [Natranaeroarchaeum sulfidigenes]